MAAEGDGKAYIAPWIIKMIAGAALVGSLSWASTIDKVAKTDVPVLRADVKNMDAKLEDANAKLDVLLRDRGLSYTPPQQLYTPTKE